MIGTIIPKPSMATTREMKRRKMGARLTFTGMGLDG